MKKKLSILLATLMVGATFVGCGAKEEAKNVPTSEIVESIKEKVEMRALGTVEGELLTEKFHLNLDDVENYAIYETERRPGPGFIMIVKAKDGKVENVKNSMEKVLEDKIGQAFYPEEQEVAENATIEVDGNFVSLFLLNSEVEADAEKMYNNLIKK